MKNLFFFPSWWDPSHPFQPCSFIAIHQRVWALILTPPSSGFQLLPGEQEQHHEMLATSHGCDVLGASPKSEQDQQGRATYQLRGDLKLTAAGRAPGEEGQRGTSLLPCLPRRTCPLFHGCHWSLQPGISLLPDPPWDCSGLQYVKLFRTADVWADACH